MTRYFSVWVNFITTVSTKYQRSNMSENKYTVLTYIAKKDKILNI